MIEQIFLYIFNFVSFVIYQSGYFGVFFLMLLESAAVPIPSEIIMPFSGYLAYDGKFIFWLVVLVGTIGNLIGSLILYYLGYLFGRELVFKYGKYLLIHKDDFLTAERWFQKYGTFSVFFSRLIPALRTFFSFIPGIFKMNLLRFSIVTLVGSFLWSFLLAYAGFVLGSNWQSIRVYFEKFDILIAVILLALIFLFLKRHFKK